MTSITRKEQGLLSGWSEFCEWVTSCLLYTSDAADDMQCVDLGGRRIIKLDKHEVVPVWEPASDLEPSY